MTSGAITDYVTETLTEYLNTEDLEDEFETYSEESLYDYVADFFEAPADIDLMKDSDTQRITVGLTSDFKETLTGLTQIDNMLSSISALEAAVTALQRRS